MISSGTLSRDIAATHVSLSATYWAGRAGPLADGMRGGRRQWTGEVATRAQAAQGRAQQHRTAAPAAAGDGSLARRRATKVGRGAGGGGRRTGKLRPGLGGLLFEKRRRSPGVKAR